MRGGGGVIERDGRFRIRYWHGGKVYVRATDARNVTEARNILRATLEAISTGKLSAGNRATVQAVADEYRAHLELRRGKDAERSAAKKLKPVTDALGTRRAIEVTDAVLERYMTERRKKVGPATINREVAYLHAALRLAFKRGAIAKVPHAAKLTEPAPRQGFWASRAELEQLAEKLPEHLQDMARFGFLAGWRLGEVLGLEWSAVSLEAKPHAEIRLPRTKNGEGRVLPLVGELDKLIRRRWDARVVERSDGTKLIASNVFHRDGAPIRDFRKSWETAIDEAKVPRRTWHDFRRTAARNLVNAGAPEKVAMLITGHKTASIFRRYHIIAQADAARALEAVETMLQTEQPAKAAATPIRRAKRS